MNKSTNSIQVLIAGPHLSLPGGVANIYRTILWNVSDRVEYFPTTPSEIQRGIFFLPKVILTFIFKIKEVKIIQLNPSLDIRSLIRDGFLILLSKLMNKRIIVFFHGWDENLENFIKRKLLIRNLFSFVFNKVDAYCLLGETFNLRLKSLGVKVDKVFYLPTVADDTYFKQWPIVKSSEHHEKKAILFLSRFDKNKGLDIVLETFQELEKLQPGKFRLVMAGDGPQFETFKKKVADAGLDGVKFEGFVEGKKKHQAFCDADIFFLPSLSEGLPCVIMEAMLYGLPIVTRPIGAIPYWVKQHENGWLSITTDPRIFAEGIISLINMAELLPLIKNRNTTTALNHFTPAKIKQAMQFIHNQVLNGFSEHQ